MQKKEQHLCAVIFWLLLGPVVVPTHKVGNLFCCIGKQRNHLLKEVLVGHTGTGSRETDGCHGFPFMVQNRGRYTADIVLHLSQIERIALTPDAGQLFFQIFPLV